MATPFPSIELTADLLSVIRETFDAKYLAGIDRRLFEKTLAMEFFDHGCRPLARRAMDSATSPEWGLGGSKTEVARRLGMERTRVSDAHLKGDLGLAPFIGVKHGKGRKKNFVETQDDMNEMNRAGFIAAVIYLRSFVHDRPSLDSDSPSEWEYELVCEMLTNLLEWSEFQLLEDESGCSYLIKKVAARKDILPSWRSNEHALRIHRLMDDINMEKVSAHKYLKELYDKWHDIFICTAFELYEAELQYSLEPDRGE